MFCYWSNCEVCYPDEDTPSGVLAGHAYSVIDVFTIEIEVKRGDYNSEEEYTEDEEGIIKWRIWCY